jgi:uncharacterized membrane protein YccF (DUF307 family)
MDTGFRHTALRALLAGSCASLLSAVVLVIAGHRETGSAAAPINAVSHWCWDREALHRQRIDGRHTVTGYAIHHVASIFWAALLSAFLRSRPALNTLPRTVAACFATSAIASAVDFKVAPERLTPGFEHRLSRTALVLTYVLFGVGLALGSLALAESRESRGPRGLGAEI